MKRKVLCITLALLMCMMVTVPTFADGEADTPPERTCFAVSFGLNHVSGSTYEIWAQVLNPAGETIDADLALLTAGFTNIITVGTTCSNQVFYLSRNVNLPSSGTYYLRLTVRSNDINETMQKKYYI